MRRLYPADGVEPVDMASDYSYPPRLGRPWVRANMVSSIDGAVSVAGRSAGLSSPADKQLFALLRALADVVLVGAGTVRTEGYGPARIREEHSPLRAANGSMPSLPIAVVSRSLDLDLSSELFSSSHPIVITCAHADPRRLDAVARDADIVVVGEEDVDLGDAMVALQHRGLSRVLCEGGPRLLGGVLRAQLLDELCLTFSPLVVGGRASRIIVGDDAVTPMALAHLLEEEGFLFARYLRS